MRRTKTLVPADISSFANATFRLTADIPAKHFGFVMAALHGKTENTDIQLVKDLPKERNTPRGSFKDAIKEFIGKSGAPIDELKAKLRQSGFSTSTVHTQITKMVRDRMLKRNRNNFIILGTKEF